MSFLDINIYYLRSSSAFFDVNIYLHWKSCRLCQRGTKCNTDQNSEGGVTYVLNYTHKYNIDIYILCSLAVSIPTSLSALIYLHLTRGSGQETKLVLVILRIGMSGIMLAPWVFFLVSVPFRYFELSNFEI